MKTRLLGKGGPEVSAVGLGCMGMSDFYGAPTSRDDAESVRTIHAALEAGVTLFNTGDFYGCGHNEMLLGRALAGKRDRAVISVKFGVLRTPTGGFSGVDGRPQAVKNFAAYSLRRLGVDVIDVYQPARVDPAVPLEDTVGAVADLIREGKVRALGVSEMNAEQLRRAHAVHPVAALEVEYSLATRVIEPLLLPTARQLGVAVVAYGALSRGLLSGALPSTFAPNDFRAHAPRFHGDNLRHNLEKVAALTAVARNLGCTPAQLAIAWVLSRGEDVVALVGTTQRTRLAENLGALDVKLDGKTLALLDDLFAPNAMLGERYHPAMMGSVVR